jgi:hypothetical protein
MKITKSQLRQIIKEAILQEDTDADIETLADMATDNFKMIGDLAARITALENKTK